MHPSKKTLLQEVSRELVDYVVGRFDPDPDAGEHFSSSGVGRHIGDLSNKYYYIVQAQIFFATVVGSAARSAEQAEARREPRERIWVLTVSYCVDPAVFAAI